MKASFHWQVSREQRTTRMTHHNLSIADLLIATTAVAFAIACLRAGIVLDLIALATIGPILVALAVFALLAGIPQLFFALWFRRVALGLVLLTVWMLLLLATTFATLAVLIDGRPLTRVDWPYFTIMAVGSFIGLVCFLTAPLLLARLIGFRLHRGEFPEPDRVEGS
jgi:hypothetical protein